MATAFEGSLTEKMLNHLVAIRQSDNRPEITSTRLQQTIKSKFPKFHFSVSGFGSAFERIKNYGILADSGATLGRSKIMTIVPPADDIIPLYQHKGDANAMADARARNASLRTGTELAPDEKVAEQIVEKSDDDDEISAWEFGEKVIRYISIFKQKLNERDSMLRDRSDELTKAKNAIKGLQREVNIKEGKIKDLREGMKRHVSRSVHEEALQKIKRLESLVDELRQRRKKSSKTFKLGELASFK